MWRGQAMSALGNAFDELVDSTALAGAALELALSLGHSPWNCYYLALAEHRNCRLVTADATFLELLRRRRRLRHVVPLWTWSS